MCLDSDITIQDPYLDECLLCNSKKKKKFGDCEF